MKSVLFIVFSIVILLGCNKDEEKSQIENLLIGEWILVSFVNEQNGTSINADNPEYFDPIDNTQVSIIINFKENFRYDGVTSRNSFSGNYTFNNSETVIIFKGPGGQTEVGETEFGKLFFDNLLLNYNPLTQQIESNFEVSGDVLKLYYSNVEFMRFLRL